MAVIPKTQATRQHSSLTHKRAVAAGRHDEIQPGRAPTNETLAGLVQRAHLAPDSLTPLAMNRLQHTLGNRTVNLLLQRAQPAVAARPVAPRASRSLMIQAKLLVGPAGDRYEQEADRLAARVLAQPAPSAAVEQPAIQRIGDDAAAVQAKLWPGASVPGLQRRDEGDEGKTRSLPPLAVTAAAQDPRAGFEAEAAFEDRLRAQRGGGYSLPGDLRRFMEARFGADFSGVRLHIGREAARLNREISAQAFTQGQDIYIGEGRENVASNAGRQLLAHELTHVVQQTGSTVQRRWLTASEGEAAHYELNVARTDVRPTLSGLGQAVVQRMFSAGSMSFAKPTGHQFTAASALAATQPIPRGQAGRETGRASESGVEVGDVGSYQYVQYLEKPGDRLTGDHQPSGAAVKEAIRELLHTALSVPLTRSMAKNAYAKAITIVMTDAWHKLSSRTYGGRNTKDQILKDAKDLMQAAMADWQTTVKGLLAEGFTAADIQIVWTELNAARETFFRTGTAQVGTL